MKYLEIIKAREAGESYQDIADRLEMSKHTVQEYMNYERVIARNIPANDLKSVRGMAEQLELERRIYLCFLKERIWSIEILLERLNSGRGIRNFGPTSYNAIVESLRKNGLLPEDKVVPVRTFLALDDMAWQSCLQYWGKRCAVCGASPETEGNLQQDHWVPKSLSFSPGTTPSNMVPLCWRCNVEKSASDPYLWLVEKLGKAAADQKMREILDYFAHLGKLE